MNNNQNHNNSAQVEKNISSFDTLFDTQLNPAIEELAELRTQLRKKSKKIIAPLLIGIIIIDTVVSRIFSVKKIINKG